MPGVRREVRVDELLRLLAADPGARGQPEVAHPVGEPEVDHLGHRALVLGDLRRILLEHRRGRLAMDVRLALERRLEVLVARDVGDDPQLDLGVVRGDQHGPRGRRQRTPAGCAGRAASGSGCSGGSGRTTTGGRLPRRPGGMSCAGGRHPRSASAAPRRRSIAASCRCASRGPAGRPGGRRRAPPAPRHPC